MCGIAGILDWSETDHRQRVSAMVTSLRHRGPDAQHVKAFGAATLGHARLSVIDLSPAADQPMSSSDGRFHIVFNGEIYNFTDLRRELEGMGAQFRTRSDTEVILEAYKCWGDDCMTRFNGMFAFALWDAEARRLLIARDRFGKKPLFYAPLKNGLIFASSPTALLFHPEVPRTLNPAAMRQALTLSYVLGSDCIHQGSRKLEPGHRMILEPGRPPRCECYWDLAPAFATKGRWRSEDEAAEALTALLSDAVRLRMQSDVPLGAFLSGGIDSALILALMGRQESAFSPLRSFSAGFAQAGFDETPLARRVAGFLGTDHADCQIDSDCIGTLPLLMECVGEPFADTSLLPTYDLSGFARKSVTVSLTGDGGDELFAGYETYAADRLHGLLQHLPHSLIRLARTGVERCWPASFGKVSLDYKLKQFLAGLDRDFSYAHYSWRTLFTPEELQELVRPECWAEMAAADPYARFRHFHDSVSHLHWLDRAAYIDIKTWLVDDILVKVDRASMAHGLEARSPFLDYRVAEFAASLPPEMRLKGLGTKHILKRLHGRYYPPALRPDRKRGFNSPIAHWFHGPQREAAKELTASPELNEWLTPNAVNRLWQDHETRRRDNSFRLFTLACLGSWLKQRNRQNGEIIAEPNR